MARAKSVNADEVKPASPAAIPKRTNTTVMNSVIGFMLVAPYLDVTLPARISRPPASKDER
jgi:hypothetical protein